jgi:hypothetical protein
VSKSFTHFIRSATNTEAKLVSPWRFFFEIEPHQRWRESMRKIGRDSADRAAFAFNIE